MDNEVEQRIRERAYELWVQSGQEGPAEEHWLQAEREVMGTPNEVSIAGTKESRASDDASTTSAAADVIEAAERPTTKATASKGPRATKSKRPS